MKANYKTQETETEDHQLPSFPDRSFAAGVLSEGQVSQSPELWARPQGAGSSPVSASYQVMSCVFSSQTLVPLQHQLSVWVSWILNVPQEPCGKNSCQPVALSAGEGENLREWSPEEVSLVSGSVHSPHTHTCPLLVMRRAALLYHVLSQPASSQSPRCGSGDMDHRHAPTQPCPSCKLMHYSCSCADRGACVEYGFSSFLPSGVQDNHPWFLRPQYSSSGLVT